MYKNIFATALFLLANQTPFAYSSTDENSERSNRLARSSEKLTVIQEELDENEGIFPVELYERILCSLPDMDYFKASEVSIKFYHIIHNPINVIKHLQNMGSEDNSENCMKQKIADSFNNLWSEGLTLENRIAQCAVFDAEFRLEIRKIWKTISCHYIFSKIECKPDLYTFHCQQSYTDATTRQQKTGITMLVLKTDFQPPESLNKYESLRLLFCINALSRCVNFYPKNFGEIFTKAVRAISPDLSPTTVELCFENSWENLQIRRIIYPQEEQVEEPQNPLFMILE